MKKLTINRKDLKNNLKIIRKRLYSPGKDDSENFPKIIAVVKGNGMGLGLVEYSKFLVNNGIDCLAVSNLEEVTLLREAGIEEEILMLTPTAREKELEMLVQKAVTLTVSSKAQIEMLEKIAEEQNTDIKAHIKIDTGFGRYGFLYTDLGPILEAFQMCNHVKICGMYTHFARPMDEKFTEKQFHRFLDVVAYLKKEGQDPRYITCFRKYSFFKISNYEFECSKIADLLCREEH